MVTSHDCLNLICKLILDCLQELIKGLKIARVAGLDGSLTVILAAAPVKEHELHCGTHIVVRIRSIATLLASQVSFYTATRVPIPGLTHRNALIQHHFNADLVVVERWESSAKFKHFGNLLEEFIGVARHVVAYRQGRLIQLHINRCL